LGEELGGFRGITREKERMIKELNTKKERK